jgi:hypothetical protein
VAPAVVGAQDAAGLAREGLQEQALLVGASLACRAMRPAVAAALIALCAVTSVAQAAAATPPPSGQWHQVQDVTFYAADALLRSQGMATDGRDLFFSWQGGLLHTTADGRLPLGASPVAIPLDLALHGSNHIGDIDVRGHTLYAPIEDGGGYARPYLVLYDTRTLLPTGVRYLLPRPLLTEGVPWVAVDAARGQLYTAEWNDTRVLNVHSLANPLAIRTVALSTTLGRIQGAKMLNGLLYAAEDNGARKSIVAIDPDTGVVYPVFDQALGADTEAEGLAFTTTPQGTLMRTLYVAPSRLAVHMRTYLRTAT